MKKSFFKIIIFIVAAVIITGCGRSSSDLRSGNFAGPPVEGLGYSTETLSGIPLAGVTDSSGRFHYLNGEIVTFRIGGLVLGTIKGDRQINLFDLCDVVPPVDKKELDSYSKNPPSSSFTRLINIVVLLQSLDQSSDPEAGVVITEEVSALISEESFDLTLNPEEFNLQLRQFYLRAREAGIKTVMVTPESAVTHLYDGLAAKPSLKQIKRVSIDNDDDGIEDHYVSFGYSTAGKLISKVQNLVGLNSTESWEYDDDQLLVSVKIDQETDIEGQQSTQAVIMNYIYDDTGRLINEDLSQTVDGLTMSWSVSVYYDAAGRITRQEMQEAVGNDATMTGITSFFYDDQGNPEMAEMQSTSVRGDEVQTEIETQNYKYNEKNQRIEEATTSVRTSGGDTVTYTRLMTNTYTADGQMEKREGTTSVSGRNRTTIELFDYNDYGQPVSRNASNEETYNGDTINSLMTLVFSYDQYGFMETANETRELFYNAVRQSRDFVSYDGNQNILQMERSFLNIKMSGQNQPDSKIAPQNIDYRFSYISDDNKNIVLATADKDSDGEPEIIQSFEYDEVGYVVSRKLSGEESDSSYTYTYNENTIALEDVDPSSFEDIYDINFDSDFYFSYDRELISSRFVN